MNIPVFRAKKIDSDEYVVGNFDNGVLNNHKHIVCGGTNTEFIYDNTEDENGKSHMGECFCFDCEEYGEQYNKDENLNTFISNFVRKTYYIRTKEKCIEIDPITLAIHFPDMLDSQGNKIFASLSKDGKGGDIMQSEYYTRPVIYRKGMFYLKDGHCLADDNYREFPVIGIQE